LSDVAIAEAKRRGAAFGAADRARFEVADLSALPFPDETFDAAISIAVIWGLPDPASAMAEMARVLKRDAPFVFTNSDRERSPPGAPPPISDHRPLLMNAGFSVEVYEPINETEALRRRVYELVIERRHVLEEEMGKPAADGLAFEANRALGLIDGVDYFSYSRPVFVVARRR
jgi:SAM-dependent methyltransferase